MAITIPSPSQTALLPLGRDYLSYSAVRLYQQCPLRYFFRYVRKLPERTVSASLIFGSAIHRAIELHFRRLQAQREPADLEELYEAYLDTWQSSDDKTIQFGQDDRHSLDLLAKRVLQVFHQSNLAHGAGRVLAVEQEIRLPLIAGVPNLLARVDLITETAEAVVLTDFKTSRSRWNNEHVQEAAEQLVLYGQLVREVYQKSIRLQFAVITKTKAPSFDVFPVPWDNRRAQRTTTTVRHVWQAIEGRHFYPAPSSMQCPSCPYRTECVEWQGYESTDRRQHDLPSVAALAHRAPAYWNRLGASTSWCNGQPTA
jgi:putative RecB family exonuclease